MGREAAAQFIALLAEDQDLGKQVAGGQLAALVELAAQRGLEFTVAELEQVADSLVRLQSGELTDAELAGVSGGAMGAASTQGPLSADVLRTAAGIKQLGAGDAVIIVSYGAGMPGSHSFE